MRFIGNKELIAPEIGSLLRDQGLLDQRLTLFDAFCGTGAVSDYLKGSFNLKINDILEWCVIYTRGRIVSHKCTFSSLGFDPFERLNASKGTSKGFFFQNYSPGGSDRMYFTPENASKIDHIRREIEKWMGAGRITGDEYAYLLASLIESVSAVSNTAGVYGAFLKHWDPRAKRALRFSPVMSRPVEHAELSVENARVEDIIERIDCDILYLDPPYTQNQYGTQYHILETLVKNDNPSISVITGSRPVTPMRSAWSQDIRKQIVFDRVIAKTRAKYILFSYSADGFMSKNYIESVLKRYGEPETLVSKLLSYRKYTNFKSRKKGDHFEYLFFIKKKDSSRVQYVSPLNYIGSKTRMVPFLQQRFPTKINTFVDAFGGGFNVGINSDAKKIVYNDYNHLVTDLMASFRQNDTAKFIQYVRHQIRKYGLEKENSRSYVIARDYYNSLPSDKRDPRLLFAIIMYGFNQQIRFNADLDFNNPVGQRWFNERILEKLVSFSRVIKEKNVLFKSVDFSDLISDAKSDSFVYLDPPYRLTVGAYNDGKRGFQGWGVPAERRLLCFAEQLNSKSVRFMLSYVLKHKGRENGELSRWIAKNNFRMIEYGKTQGIGRREVVIFNYE